MDWESRRRKRQEMGGAASGNTSANVESSNSIADAWERRRTQRRQMDAGSEEARRQRSEEVDRINQERKDQRSLELAQDIALGIVRSVANHWIHPYRSSQAGQTSQMTAEEAGQKHKENQAKIAELEKTVRMGAGKVHTPEVEAQLDALEKEQKELSQYIQQLEDAEAMQHDSAYWAKKASHEEERLREANAYRSGYGGVMQSGVLPDTEKAQSAEEIQRQYDLARENYFDAKDAENWDRMTPELQEKAMEAAALDVNGLFDWQDGDALSRSGLSPDQRAAQSKDDASRLAQLRKEISDAGFDADRILDYANRLRDNQKKQEETRSFADFASDSTAGAIAATAVSYVSNLLSGIGSVGILAQRIFGSGSGVTGYRPVNYNAPSTIFSSVTSATREAVSAQMGETGQFFYGTLNSAVDSAARMLVAKAIGTGFLPDSAGQAAVDRVNRIVSGAVSAQMSTQVFTDAFLAAKQSGATDDDAILDALVQASIEGITEKYSVDAILKNPNNLVLTALRNNFIAEGSEEIASDFLNTIYDELKNGSDSELRSAAQKYIDAGLDPKEAWKLVLGSYAKQVVLDGLAGGISGIAMGGAAELADYTQRLQAYTQPYSDRGNVQALVDEALELDPENPLAASVQRKLSEKGGDSVSNREIYRLVRQNETAIQEGDRAAVQSAAAARLSELGETGDVGAIGAALAKQAAGEELSGAEQQLISSSRYGQRVANELDPEKIRSGGFSSSWAERIGTNRLNPEEYSRLVEAAQLPGTPENAAEEPEVQAEKPAEEPAEAAVQAKPAAAAPVLPQRETAAQAEEAAAADATEQESPVTLEDASKKYGAQAGAMVHTYQPGQDVAAYDRAYEIAYEMGRSGVNRSYAMKSGAAAYLTETQRELAYEAGQAAADTAAASQAEKNTRAANGRTGWKKGTVRGEGVTIADLKQTFNDPQGQAYRYLSAVAEATGIDIALYKSEANAEGEFEGAQGRFLWDENTIYIDVNAGLAYAKDAGEVSKYAMLRTFAHEFTHFIEKWNPVQYNEFRKVVFDTLTGRGENVHDLIEEKQAQDSSGKMTYEQASREVVAEAMTDILPDSSFVQELAENHRSIFTKLHEKLKEFVKNLRAYFNSIGHNRSREANALKEQVGDTVKYLGSIVQLFDRAAVQAVENYQKTVATEEAAAYKNTTTEEPSAVGDKTTPTMEEIQSEVQEPVTETDPYGFTITDNPEHGSLEITFGGKPSWQVRDALKANKFRWNGKKGVWYGYGDRSAIVESLHAAYEAEGQTAADAQPISEPVEEAEPVSTDAAKPAEAAGKTPSEKLADSILSGYLNGENVNRTRRKLTARELYALADAAFGGTQAEGAYNRKDAYDALELAVNKFLLSQAAADTFNGNAADAVKAVQYLESLLELLPTQSVRTQEQQEFQQFSTPPNIAYLAAWAANIRQNDAVLEPSAGIGGLAVFAKAWGAEVAVNELSERRLEVLRSMGFDHLFHENAEQIDNILPEEISPGVVLMNPPFSATAGRTGSNKTSNAERHLDQALSRLRSGGRLVAILGKGMNNTDYARYWNRLRRNFNIRANLSIDGSNYKKYGTTWGVQLVVIDKTGPQTGETITGSYTDLTELPNVLEGIRNDRSNLEETGAAGGGDHLRQSVSDRANRLSEGGHTGSRVRSAGDAAGDQSGANRKGAAGNGRNGRRSVQGGVPEAGPAAAGSQDGGGAGTAGRGDSGSGNVVSQSGASDRHQPELPLPRLSEQEAAGDDGVYAAFVAPEIPLKGGKRHPAMLVESAAMAAVSMPEATYRPKLPDDVVKQNLSDAQLVTVTYAGQAHAQMLPDGRRKGFFIGDGTGVGKGRQIAGIILDNFMQGRKKAVWISKNDDLYGDAVRDWTATTGRSRDEVVNHSKFKPRDRITIDEGILFTSYGKLKAEKGGSRLDQIVDWLGEDFDGVVAFDEAHFMGNLFGKKGKFGKSSGSLTAKAGVELQRRLPNARILYVSATAATEVDNLAYAERIGLWGAGTAFTDAKDFISKIGSSGLAAMELVIRDMKAMGSYVARSISYNGVTYDTVEHTLTPMQTEIYNTMSRAWQSTMSNALNALEITGGKNNSTERQRALGNFYSSMQRFYNQVLTSMSMPSVIADMRRELAAGHSCVLQIVNTNEAQQNKQLAEAKAEGRSLDDLDLTPREALIGYLMNSFPTQMFEEYTDDDGNLRSRPVYDSSGKPVQSKEAIRKRDALIEEVNRMSIPDGPLEMLFDAFGTDAVAENTGRSRRVVPKKMPDGSISRVEERRTLNHRTADVQAFQDGKKRILVFSDAGGTGKSYHADLSEKNQQLRVHYVLQPGWVASNAVQGFGRTNRSNQALPPQYKLVTTNIKGQKRFTSTIARRLDQLGALTKGQRDTGSGMFGAKDNLETDLARDSLREFYRRLGKNQIEGVDGMKTLDRLGLRQKFTDEYGAFKLNDVVARDISTFLNRILALEVEEQNTVFDAFISIYEMELEAAIQSGTLDTGMENVRADRIEVVDDKVIRQDENTGASTHYIQAKTYTKPKVVTTVAEMAERRQGFVGVYRTENGAVRAVFRIADKTTEWGAVQKQFRLVGPNLGAKTSVWSENTLSSKAEAIKKADWQTEWDKEVAKVPEYNEDTLHMLTGALLPIWNALPQEGNTRVKRLVANDGSTYLGRVIEKDRIDSVLRRFSLDRTREVFTAQQVMDKALQSGVRFQLENSRAEIFRSRVSGEWRLEITQQNAWYLTRSYPGIIEERIQYRDRYFIPVGEKGTALLEKLLSDNPVRNTVDGDAVQEQSRAYLSAEAEEFRADIEDWEKRGRPEGETFILGSTGDVLQGLGAIESDIYMLGKKISAILEKHAEMTLEEIKKIPQILENPILILKSRNTGRDTKANTRIVMFGTVKAQNGLPVLAILDLKPIEDHLVIDDMQKVSSAYTKDHQPVYFVQNSDVLYADKKRTAGLLRSIGFQMPIDLLRSGYIGSISYSGTDVNISGSPFREVVHSNTVQEQRRISPLTDREVLAMAASEIPVDELTDAERNALRIFQERLSKLEELQEQRKELGQLYREQQFGKNPDREEAAKTLNRMHILDGQIQRASTDVLGVEEKTVLRRVLQKARTVVERQERQHGQEILKRWRDRRNNAAAIKKYRERIRKDVDDLTSWVLHPGNKDVVKHIPDALKGSVIPFLSSINFTSERSLRGGEATKADKEFLKRLNGLEAALKQNRDVYGLYSGYNDLPADFMDTLHAFIKNVQEITGTGGEFVINRMTSEELKTLSGMVKALKTYIKQFNRFHANAMYQHVYEAGDDTIQELSGMENAGPHTGKISNFVFWQQIRPAYAFERFGKGGMAIYDGLRRGQARLAFNTRTITEFTDKTYTAEEVRAWEKEIKELRLGDDLVKMPVSAIMSFYELSKRPQALGHILGQGIRVATYVSGKQKISDIGHVITPEDVSAIIAALTPRQKEVADSLQKFMAGQGGKWGNYVSVKRFGEELFGEEHYFPIHSDGRHLQATADEHPSAASLYALLNMSFTKELTEKANNRIILYSIFDVFSNHMASMAQYNAFALPVLDALKWFNYQQRDLETREVLDSVRDQMDRVYGVPEESRPGSGRRGYAETFVINILKAFNGTEAQGVPTDTTGLDALRRYNMAQVAYNFRVVVQQPLAITRAGLLVDYTSILKGMKLRPAAIRQNIAEMRRYSGIAAWKALGFYDVNISRGLTEIIKHKETVLDKVSEVGMWGAEQADTITWAAIWSACKEEVTKKQKLRPRDAGFYEAVTKLFEDVIYKTQVVDSVLTKNEYLRSKGFFARAIGSFMSEPTTTASMLIDAFDKYRADLQRGMTKTQAWKKNRSMIGRTAYVYAVSALILAAVQAAADAFRDDDDYETFGEKWLEAFGGNLVDELMPLNKLPVLSDFYEVAKELLSIFGVDTYGNAPRSVFMQWYDSLVKGVQILHDRIYGDDTNYTWYGGIYKLLQAVSGMTGLPMAAATREMITAWNTVVGSMAPSLKVQTYEPKPMTNIRYAYEDGYLTAEEATAELLAQDLVEDEDEAYFTIQGWEAGDGYSRFDAIFGAARNGGSIDAEMEELTAHGYTEKDILSKIKSQIGTWYKEGEITKQQAEKLLAQYFDLDSDEIKDVMNKWSCVVVTGIEYDDIKQEYLDGNLTEQRAVEMRVKYGGYSEEEATETVTKWKAEKETGVAYDDIQDAFLDGDISEADARNMYITYGGYSEEDATETVTKMRAEKETGLAYDDIKDALLDGEITEANARRMYVKYGGYSEEEATEKVTVILFVGEHPDCEDISYAAIEDYTTYCETAGVSASTFYDAWKYNSGTHADVDENGKSVSGSKKVKVLAYIDALPLTAAQKDSLYYAFGWAESTIGESPWH